MATKYNIDIDQGSDYEALLTVSDNNQNAIDLTGYSFKGAVAVNLTNKSVVFNISFDVLNQSTNKGQAYMRVPRATTNALNIKARTKYVYDVKLVTPHNKEERLFEGEMVINPGVTP